MKQKYFFSLVCLCFLLASQLSRGQSFSHKSNKEINRVRSTYEFKKALGFKDLFNYPEGYDTKAAIADSSNVTITFNSTDESHLKFLEYLYSKWSGQYFKYIIPAGAYGTDTLTVSVDYNGVTARALIISNITPTEVNDDSYTVDIGETLEMNLVKNDQPSAYLNKSSLEILGSTNFGAITNNNDGTLTYVNEGSTSNYSFEYFKYRIADTDGNYDTATVKINIHKNAYASRVIEYMPAPGQFTNEFIGQSNSAEKVLGKKGGMISLGGFGGYVILGFDQPVFNNPQNPYGVDFSVKGNSFVAHLYGVWTEPAAVRVMKDVNGDGIPNDGEWYELAGSDYYMSSTKKNVKMTYYNPHYDKRYTVPWKTNNGESGALLSNVFHQHSYYPDPFDFGCSKDSITYEGNVIKSTLDMSTPSYIEFYRAPIFGYCDSRGNSADLTKPQNPYFPDEKGKAADGFDISWAVDRNGNHVELDQIDFVKIYTAGNANAGWLGEWSSEVLGAAITTPDPDYVQQDYYLNYIGITQLKVLKGQTCQFEGFLFKNGRPVTEGTQKWWLKDSGVGTVDNTGLFTAVSNGETWLHFSQKEDISADSIRVQVVELEGVVIEMEGNSPLSAKSTSLIVGETISITAQATDNIGSVLNGSKSNRYAYETYTWTTSNSEIGTIYNGLFTGKKVGNTMVYAHSDSNPELSDSILVTVKKVPQLNPVNNPVKISYNNPVGEKTSGELFATGTNSTTYLNSVVSKYGLAKPVIEKNKLKCNFTEGVYGKDTLTFNLTSYKRDTTISVAFIYEPDGYEKGEQILYVNNALIANPGKSSLNAYSPNLDETTVIDDQFDSYAIKDVLVDGAFAFVSGDNFLNKYNLSTYEKTNSADLEGIGNGELAVYNNILLVAGQSNLAIYYKSDLTLCKNINLSGKIHSVQVAGDKAYVFLANEASNQLNSVAVVDLVLGTEESRTALSSAGIIPSTTLHKGTKFYITGTLAVSGNTAVLEYDTENNTFLVTDTGNSLENTLNAAATLKGDSILLAKEDGYVAYTISTKTLGSDVLLKAADDFFPTGVIYHASLGKCFATYSNAAKTASKGSVFGSTLTKVADFSGVETMPSLLTDVGALDENEKPLPNLVNDMRNINTFEKAKTQTAIYLGKSYFTDLENNFDFYPRYLEHSSWLMWDKNYTSWGNKRLHACYTNTVDKDSVVTITVDAIDNYGFSATRTFDITILPHIYKPILRNTIADTIVEVSSAAIQISLADLFTLTPSSGVSFEKAVSGNTNSGLVATSIENNTLSLSLTPGMKGEALITVKGSAVHSSYGVKFTETSFKIIVVDTEAPSAPTNLTGVSAETSIALSWTASTDNANVTGYKIYLDGDSVNTVAKTNYMLSGLWPATEHKLEVVAFDEAGNTSEKAMVMVSTIKDVKAPTVPVILSAVPDETSISLSWRASKDNVTAVTYRIYVNNKSKFYLNRTSYTITGLTIGAEYTLELEAVDNFGNRSQKSEITVSTIDKSSPSVPTNLTAVPSETAIAFSWGASTDNVNIAGYNVFFNDDFINTVDETNYSATGLNSGSEYVFEVEAIDLVGNKSERALLTVATTDETAPSVPEDLVAEAGETSISLSWAAPTDNVGVAGYTIYQAGIKLGTVADESFSVTGLIIGNEYSFEIEAFDAAGNKSEKAEISVSTIDETTPTIPGDLAAVPTDSSVALSWTASTDNVGIAGYIIYLNGDSIGIETETSFTIDDLEDGTEYTFEVEAIDRVGNRSTRALITHSTLVTGLETLESARLNVYPNPFSSFITIEAESEGRAIIYDMSGKAMLHVTVNAGNNRVDTSVLPNGIYLLKQGSYTVKLIKKY
uniref:fibronectin type III domain-containing protein n=1 Tax=uncultured Draconibacterium sp. TaxID=1573823 RepID=UPI0032169118